VKLQQMIFKLAVKCTVGKKLKTCLDIVVAKLDNYIFFINNDLFEGDLLH
jgi:hypothetical protein